MSYRISVDVGGTFTDVVVADGSGQMWIGKGSTRPGAFFRGMEEGLGVIAATLGTDVGSLLGESDLLVYATTTATNAIVVNRTAKTAFLTTAGFPDVLTLREGGRSNAYDFQTPFPEPYIPRSLTFEIDERIDAQGDVILALDEAAVGALLTDLERRGVEAIAVCLLWSIVNPAHEQAIGRLIAEQLPDMPFTLSHELNPIIREYRRGSSTAIDASLKPLMQEHLRTMETDLRAAGFAGELLGATSFGGVLPIERLADRPINAVRSGPALAPVASLAYAGLETGATDVIACDTGGTSFDVSLGRDGVVKFTQETWLGPQWTGHMTGFPSVDARSIGAGGGSIAWIDAGGLLRVGPQSAGAQPGPACYGRGGTEATVTDAAVVLGYIDPEHFLGGRMELDVAQAVAAIERVAEPLGQSVDQIAHGILTIANEAMVQAIQEITINEGLDPRESLLVAGGGAAGLNIVPIAAELGCDQILVPRTAGAFSACGAQYSDIVGEFSKSRLAQTHDFDADGVNDVLGELTAQAEEFADSLRAKGLDRFETAYSVEARYVTQVWELPVPLAKGEFTSADDVEQMRRSFHDVHERVFAVREDGADVECLNWKVRLTGILPRGVEAVPPSNGSHVPQSRGEAPAYFAATGRVPVPRYEGGALHPGMEIRGPAVIEEPTTTIVVYPSSHARVTKHGHFLLTLDHGA